MNGFRLLAGFLLLSLVGHERSLGGDYPPTFSDFRKRADAMSEGSRAFGTREKLTQGQEQDLAEMEARNPIFHNGKLIEHRLSGIDKETIHKKMTSLKSQWMVCYQSLLKKARVPGQVSLAYEIAPKGHIHHERIVLERSTLDSPELSSCLLKKLKSLRFQERPIPTIVTSYPIQFTPEPAE